MQQINRRSPPYTPPPRSPPYTPPPRSPSMPRSPSPPRSPPYTPPPRSPPYTPPPRLFDLNFKPKKQKQPKTKYNLGKQPKFYLPSPSALMFKATAHKGDLFTGQEVRGIPKSWLKGRKRW